MDSKRIIIKIGSSSLTTEHGMLNMQKMAALSKSIAELYSLGWQPVLVSSGAVAAGLGHLGWDRTKLTMPERQAAAAVGQGLLMEQYNKLFLNHGIKTAQVLLTREDLADRKRYINARNTINSLLGHQVLPVVNENDTVAFAEIRFGDNDTLSALVAGLVEAQLLVILTDTEGLYSGDPRKDPNAKLIPVVKEVDEKLERVAGGSGSAVGTGGMRTKVSAARIAARSGIRTIVTSAQRPENIVSIANGKQFGTRFEPAKESLRSRKQWIAFSSIPKGTIIVDQGAANAIIRDKKSLLAVGILDVKGTFPASSVVTIKTSDNLNLAKGISNLSSEDLRLVAGKHRHNLEVINRDWLVCEGRSSACR
ncbi:glutamate 5-kinase [Peptococcaceae bacterium 1198_IL3148]